jgi:hypothetical protein
MDAIAAFLEGDVFVGFGRSFLLDLCSLLVLSVFSSPLPVGKHRDQSELKRDLDRVVNSKCFVLPVRSDLRQVEQVIVSRLARENFKLSPSGSVSRMLGEQSACR